MPINLNKKLVFITGKGGVGKSSVVCALALHLAHQDKKCLIVELEKPSSIAPFFDKKNLETTSHLTDHIDLKTMDYAHSFKEYVLKKIKINFLYNLAFENRAWQVFLQACPGIKELIVLGHIWYFLEDPKYDHVIIDLPATGHGLSYLRVSQQIKKFITMGPLFEIACKVADMIQNSSIIYITIPEKMAVSETHDFILHLKRDLSMKPHHIFFNQCLKLPLNQDEKMVFDKIEKTLIVYPELSEVFKSIHYIKSLETKLKEYTQFIKEKHKADPTQLPYVFADKWNHEELDILSTYI